MNLLLITYEFPPKGGPGIQRPLQTARVLSELGWDVTVLTVADPPTTMLDERSLAAVPPAVRVARAWSLEPTRVLQWLKRRRGTEHTPANSSAGYSGAPRSFIRLVQALFVPDEKVGWTSYAVREAVRLHAERPFDVILASGPPFTAMRVAWKVSRRLGVPWVADIRDPIVDNYFFEPPTPLHAAYNRSFERRVAQRAALSVVATYDIAEAIASRNVEATDRIVTITNGFDPHDFPGTRAARDDRYFNISYVGSFQGDIQPDTFLDAVKRALDLDPALDHELRVTIVGPANAELRHTINGRGLGEVVKTTGFVSHEAAVREMEAADALLLVLADLPHLRATLTGKLPEYLGARRPVLALVPPGVAREVLQRTHAAEIISPRDPDAAADAIVRLHRQWKAGTLPVPDPVVVEEFDRTKLVARLSVLLEMVVAGD